MKCNPIPAKSYLKYHFTHVGPLFQNNYTKCFVNKNTSNHLAFSMLKPVFFFLVFQDHHYWVCSFQKCPYTFHGFQNDIQQLGVIQNIYNILFYLNISLKYALPLSKAILFIFQCISPGFHVRKISVTLRLMVLQKYHKTFKFFSTSE